MLQKNETKRKNVGLYKRIEEEIQKEKEQCKRKVESHFTYNNMRRALSDMKLMIRYVNGNTQKISSVNTADEANELNQFFSCFNCHNFLQNTGRSMMFLNRASAEDDDV